MMYPKWATPARRAQLVRLLEQSRGLCVHGHPDCPQLGDTFEEKTTRKVVCRQYLKAPFSDSDEVVLKVEVVEKPRVVRTSGHCYEVASEEVIADWKAQDRVERERLWRLEQRQFHAAPQLRKRGEFDSIRREQYLADRPVFRIVAIGLSALTFKRVAQVEIPGLKKVIFVDLSGINLEGVKSRKLAHYKRGSLPKGLVAQVEARVQAQVAKVL